jgi:hypothetical protein
MKKFSDIEIRNKYLFLMASARVTLTGNIVASSDEMRIDFQSFKRDIFRKNERWTSENSWSRRHLFLHELLHLKRLQRVGLFNFIVEFLTFQLHNEEFELELSKLIVDSPKEIWEWWNGDFISVGPIKS